MTPQEFKAWFDGFTEALEGIPNEDQWKRIKARVGEIDGKSVTYPIYVDRYWPSYPRPYYPNRGTYLTNTCGGQIAGNNSSSSFTVSCNADSPDKHKAASEGWFGNPKSFDSTKAMYVLGRADAISG